MWRMRHSRAVIRLSGHLAVAAALLAPAPAAARTGLFERVVILGASVSAGEKAPSPGLLLARHIGTPAAHIYTFAHGGSPSSRHLHSLDAVAAANPTLIVAVDLFYHDFAFSLFLSEGKKRYIRDYIARLHATGAVVVVGNIPSLVLLRHEHVNEYLDELAAGFPRLVLLDVRHLIEGLDPPGMHVRTARGEVTLQREDVFADRVHPNLLGSVLVANHILERLEQRYPGGFPGAGPIPLPLPERLAAPNASANASAAPHGPGR